MHAYLYRLRSWRSRQVNETAAGSGCCRQYVRFRSSTRRHSHTCSTDHRPCHRSTKVAHSFKKKKNKETQKRRYKPHRHTLPFLSTVQLLRLKKKHKNKLHNSFFSVCFYSPAFLVVVFSLNLCLSCRICRIWCSTVLSLPPPLSCLMPCHLDNVAPKL